MEIQDTQDRINTTRDAEWNDTPVDLTTRFAQDEDVEIVDRSKGVVGPFSEIHKSPSFTNAGNLTGYAIEMTDPDHENGRRPVGTVSPNYLLVPNTKVVEVADSIIRQSPFQDVPRKVFFDGKRFQYSILFKDFDEEIQPGNHSRYTGDKIGAGLMFENSYDGSRSFRARLFAMRLACVNGLITRQYFAQHIFKHELGNEGWEDDVTKALSVVKNAPDSLAAFTRQLSTMADTRLTQDNLEELRTSDDLLGGLPVSRWGQIMDEYLSNNERSAFGLLNASTQVLWHRNKSVQDTNYVESVTDALLDYVQEHRN